MVEQIQQKVSGIWNWAARECLEKFHTRQLIVRCAAHDCSRHETPQLALVARYSGVYFRNRWYHQVSCLQAELANQIEQLLLTYTFDRGRPHRLPLGLLLITRGAITAGQLREALRRQREEGHGKLGHWLRQSVNLEEAQLTAALGQQWGCPVFPLDRQASAPIWLDGPPLSILLGSRAVPVHAAIEGRQMHIAFADRVDHTLLYALEEILGFRTHACVSGESSVNRVLEELSRRANSTEICFDSVRDPAEIAAAICSYARQLNGSRLKVARAGSYIWAAIFVKEARRDLLFRMPYGPTETRREGTTERIKAFVGAADIRKDGVLDATPPL
jgi:hypothetical protein